MKQMEFFDTGNTNAIDEKYTSKIKGPIYTPSGKKPQVLELFDRSKSAMLIENINKSNVSDQEKMFLILASYRHIVFNYRYIADYYAGSGTEMQELMEQSALVIIDFNKAIEYGYVKLSEEIADQYLEDTKNE